MKENENIIHRKWLFFGGMTVGALVMILLCLAAAIGGLVTFFFLEKPSLFTGKSTTTIDAQKGWQSTGVRVKPGMKINISVVDGEWTHWKGTQPYNSGQGGGYICAGAMPAKDCVEPMPEYSAGGLIGKIDTQVFSVGMGVTQVSSQAGTLMLRINDGDVGLYDNDGELKVEISEKR
jgi:hypothetical protein